jgi:hypothetical protein
MSCGVPTPLMRSRESGGDDVDAITKTSGGQVAGGSERCEPELKPRSSAALGYRDRGGECVEVRLQLLQRLESNVAYQFSYVPMRFASSWATTSISPTRPGVQHEC